MWQFNDDALNFVDGKPIMVTITLREYRDLIDNVATADNQYRKVQQDYLNAKERCTQLEKRIASLSIEDEE